MRWKITFYNDRVKNETLGLPDGIKAHFTRILELIEEFGPEIGRPHTARLERGLYEIRAKGREGISRSLYCTVKNREIVILLTAIKKSQTLPKRHMETARKRMKEIQAHE